MVCSVLRAVDTICELMVHVARKILIGRTQQIVSKSAVVATCRGFAARDVWRSGGGKESLNIFANLIMRS